MVAAIASIVATAASLAYMGYNAAQGAPDYSGGNAANAEVAQAQAAALPWQRMYAAMEQQGGQALQQGYSQTTYSAAQRAQLQSQLDSLNQRLAAIPPAPGNQALLPPAQRDAQQQMQSQLTQQRDALQQQLAQIPQGGGTVYLNSQGQLVPRSQAVADFRGFGTADVQGAVASKMADIQTELQQKYGPAFASLALKNAEQSDPLGFAARDKELSMIQGQLAHPTPINPLSTTLDQQVQQRVDAGSGLTSMSHDLLDKAVAQANADRGGATRTAGVENNMTTGMAGAARRQAGLQEGQAWLSSGSTPADIEYRREQQMLADLGSFVNGQTPESQFQNLSGASRGAAPFYSGQPLPQQPTNASSLGSPFSVAAWQQQVRGMGGQANSWMSGLSSLLSGLNSYSQSTSGG